MKIRTVVASILLLLIFAGIGAFTPKALEMIISSVAHPHADNPHEQSFLFLNLISLISGIIAGKAVVYEPNRIIASAIAIGFNLGYITVLGLMYIAKPTDTTIFAIGTWILFFLVSFVIHCKEISQHPGRAND